MNAAGWVLLVITGWGLVLIGGVVRGEIKTARLRRRCREAYGLDQEEE